MKALQRFRAQWEELAPRERGLILFGLLVLLPVGLYLYAWQPVAEERQRLSNRVVGLREELAQLRAAGEEVKRLHRQPGIGAAVPLEASARMVAARFQLADRITTAIPQGNERLTIQMDSAPFDAWLRWVGELGIQGIALSSCKVEALPAAGQVRVKSVLSSRSPDRPKNDLAPSRGGSGAFPEPGAQISRSRT